MRFFEYWAWNGPWPGVARVASRPPAKQEAHPDGMGVAGGDGTAPGIAAHARGRRRFHRFISTIQIQECPYSDQTLTIFGKEYSCITNTCVHVETFFLVPTTRQRRCNYSPECRRSCIRGSCRNAHGAGQHSCASAGGSKGLGTDVL